MTQHRDPETIEKQASSPEEKDTCPSSVAQVIVRLRTLETTIVHSKIRLKIIEVYSLHEAVEY